ncbi:MAG TPA: CoA pyrophosphatase [Methylocella sp.]|nr:CoA pyrophosphatase [Methylocella sp.]
MKGTSTAAWRGRARVTGFDIEPRFAPAGVFAHMRARLSLTPPQGWQQERRVLEEGRAACRLLPAAVLIGLAAYPGEVRVILTQRTAALRVHSGQIAFPGGRVEPEDETPAAAALREAQEEIGLDPALCEPLGYLDPYPAPSGFNIVPVAAKVTAPYGVRINPGEVDEAFEVPFAFLMTSANHVAHSRELNGKVCRSLAMPYGSRNIWGVTAGILRNLYERLYC